MKKIEENLDRLEVLSEIFDEIKNREYESKESLDVASLKLELIKKEIALLTYLIKKELT